MLKRIDKIAPLLNIIGLIILVISILSFLKYPSDFFKLIGYFLLMFFIGFGFINLFRLEFKSSMLHILASFTIGLCLNIFMFILLSALHITNIFSFYLLPLIGVFLILIKHKKAKIILTQLDIHKHPIFIWLILIILFCLFSWSDNHYYTNDSIITTNSLTQYYHLSVANSLDSMFPVKDMSYLGREINYHFGSYIVIFQVVTYLKIDKTSLMIYALPIFFLSMIIFMIHELSKLIFSKKFRLLFILLLLFSSIGIIIDKINGTAAPPIIFAFSYGNSYAISVLILLLLFIFIRMERRIYLFECILLTGIAATKAPYFVPLVLGYILAFSIEFWRDKDTKKLIMHGLILLPGVLYILLFLRSARSENLWVLFPGVMNITSTTLSHDSLLLNAILSFVLTLIAYLGIGIIYIISLIKDKIKSTEWFKHGSPYRFYFCIILISYLTGIFVSEVTEGNHILFLFPGHLFLFLLTLEFLFNKLGHKKVIILLLIVLLIINLKPALFDYYYDSTKFVLEDKNPSGNNLLANIKIGILESAIKITGLDSRIKMRLCSYPYDLVNGLEVLSQKEKGNFIFDKRYEVCESYNETKYSHAKLNGFIRTAMSNQQTLVEGYQLIVTQPDFCGRIYDNLLFFTIINGNENQFTNNLNFMQIDEIPKLEDMSYYQYFKHYHQNNNFLIESQNFRNCIKTKPNNISLDSDDKLNYLANYITRNHIRYILFERGDKPLGMYIESLRLESIYSSKTVNIYEVIY